MTINDVLVNFLTAMPATLANIITNNYRLLAICNHCSHTVELNLNQLIKKYGREYTTTLPGVRPHTANDNTANLQFPASLLSPPGLVGEIAAYHDSISLREALSE